MTTNVFRNGKVYKQEYACGKPLYPVKEVGTTDITGTRQTFWHDASIFTTTEYKYNILQARIRELAYLTKGITITLTAKREKEEDGSFKQEVFHSEEGVKEFVRFLNSTNTPLIDDEMRREKEIIESLLAREESRHQLLGKTIDSINMKCHDLRYHIDTYRRAQQLDEHAAFFDEVEQEIQRYEYTFHTGNAALDSVLSEKRLYCSANHILLTTMLDVSLLAPIEKSDIYSIFGNALDNAIQAVMAEVPENRSVNIRVSDVVGMTQIVFENFCSKPPEMHEGLPKTEKDTQYHGFGLRSIRYIIEKYDGHMSIDTKDQMFILSLLLPRPQQSA